MFMRQQEMTIHLWTCRWRGMKQVRIIFQPDQIQVDRLMSVNAWLSFVVIFQPVLLR